MKAIMIKRTGGPEVLEYVNTPVPEPGPGEVLVKVRAASVNYADVRIRQGLYPEMPPLPYVPGMEAAGTVEKAGGDVQNLSPGQPVLVLSAGCYARYVKAPAFLAVPLPEHTDLFLAAALPTNYLSAHLMLHHLGGMKEGGTVLLYPAAGGVGTAVIQLAKLAGIRVIGLVSSDEKAGFVTEMGIGHWVNYRREDVPKRVLELTGGKGADLILDHVGGAGFGKNFDMLAPAGQVIWFGNLGGELPAGLGAVINRHFMRNIGLRSFHLGSMAGADPMLVYGVLMALLELLREGKIRPHIHEIVPLEEAARAHRLLESGAVMGKVLLEP